MQSLQFLLKGFAALDPPKLWQVITGSYIVLKDCGVFHICSGRGRTDKYETYVAPALPRSSQELFSRTTIDMQWTYERQAKKLVLLRQ